MERVTAILIHANDLSWVVGAEHGHCQAQEDLSACVGECLTAVFAADVRSPSVANGIETPHRGTVRNVIAILTELLPRLFVGHRGVHGDDEEEVEPLPAEVILDDSKLPRVVEVHPDTSVVTTLVPWCLVSHTLDHISPRTDGCDYGLLRVVRWHCRIGGSV